MMTTFVRRARALYENLPLPAGSALGAILIVVLERLRPAPIPGPRSVSRTAGVALLATGGALNGWALAERRRRATGEFQLEQPDSIVSTGPYALTRHPMYFGWWLIHLGVGLLRGSMWVAVTLPAAVLVEHLGAGLVEERELRAEFGDEYTRYAERVPRYIGLPRRRGGRAEP